MKAERVKTERVVIEVVMFRDDDGGATDMEAMWKNCCDAFYQFCGVDLVTLREREEVDDVAESVEPG